MKSYTSIQGEFMVYNPDQATSQNFYFNFCFEE